MDGRLFRGARAIERQLKRVARKERGHATPSPFPVAA
jgi:hypothetical protein